MNSMEPAGGRLSDYFTAAARRVVIPPNAKQFLDELEELVELDELFTK